jgi:hypothetical protein
VDCSRFIDAGRLRNPEKPYSFFFKAWSFSLMKLQISSANPRRGPGAEAMHIRADRAVVTEAI